ncbi:Cystatin/monellin superfamily protein [Arabidopsis thaliana]|uniref:Cystatin/monellin superfamily protein n=1 Tax=Arabidopsis thaliana TaxID=3702 RepID=F4I201_ARATH|nr:Cystatin/monellin superfamily protein [Arabidopsis thaliana]AEE34066.2 Cystatin/monellin superfamily protein [Arabidopsis thaliana]|eukprot:NP_001319299.1 Cystatin/monellin superfamily protein [Arabidopsis thaliana]
MSEFEGWIKWLEPVFLLWKPEDPGYERPAYRDWTKEEDEPKYSPEKELALLDKQILASDGFDIDFTHFRCVFNYHLAYLDSHEFVDEPETTRDLLERLSRKALDDYNQESRTQFEFVKVVKANFHFCCAIMFLITFEVVDPYDNLIKLFQTRVRHAEDIVTEYVFCRPKPNQGVECIGVKNNDGKDVQTNVKEQEIGVGASICHKE